MGADDMTALPATLTGEALALLALEAGAVIHRLYQDGCAVMEKDDRSPVTEADHAAEAVILAGLARIAPGIPVIAEEEAAAGRIPACGNVFALVDPLDGTKEFVARSGEFTVNIAIVADGAPVIGVIYAPELGRLWVAEGPDAVWSADVAPGAPLTDERTPLTVRKAPATGLTVIASRSHDMPRTDAWLADFPVAERIPAGSSLKFCRVAEGTADLYPRFGRTMEWDTAAGHAIVLAAGGQVLTMDGAPLGYGKSERGYDNPDFVVVGDVAILG